MVCVIRSCSNLNNMSVADLKNQLAINEFDIAGLRMDMERARFNKDVPLSKKFEEMQCMQSEMTSLKEQNVMLKRSIKNRIDYLHSLTKLE